MNKEKAWIATNKYSGQVHHFSRHDGWVVEPVVEDDNHNSWAEDKPNLNNKYPEFRDSK